jgi:hypothetical protein
MSSSFLESEKILASHYFEKYMQLDDLFIDKLKRASELDDIARFLDMKIDSRGSVDTEIKFPVYEPKEEDEEVSQIFFDPKDLVL